MIKPDSVRRHLTAVLAAAYPQILTDADRLLVSVDKGRVAATGARLAGGKVGARYDYDLVLTLIDFPAALGPNAVFLPLVSWLARHQPEVLQSYSTNPEALRFELDVVAADKVDLQVTVTLSESVTAARGDDGAFAFTTHPEPEADEHVAHTGETLRLVVDGVVVAEWTEPPAPPDAIL